MTDTNNPIYLFADSQLLFWQEQNIYCLERITHESEMPLSAAYIGASNGNEPAFYAIFAAAMETIGIHEHRMIDVTSRADRDFLAAAEIILLAGGSVEMGWRAFVKNGLDRLVVERYAAGATLIGISAGAVQLGVGAMCTRERGLMPTFGLVPYLIGVHEERGAWSHLWESVQARRGEVEGLGIPAGGGVRYHADGSLEALRLPAMRCRVDGVAPIAGGLP